MVFFRPLWMFRAAPRQNMWDKNISKLTNPLLARKGFVVNVVAEQLEKFRCLAFFREEEKFTRNLFQIVPKPRCKGALVEECRPTAWFIPIGRRGYNGLADIGYKKHYRVHHGANRFARGRKHIDGIEFFWAVAQTRLSKFNGLSRNSFYLHLEECEFRSIIVTRIVTYCS